MCICICSQINSAKSARYLHLIQNRWCSGMLRYVYHTVYVYWILVLEQKNAHVSFPTGGLFISCTRGGLWTWVVLLGARQRSGEGVVRRNGYPKGCFWRVRFFSAPSRFSGPFKCLKSKHERGQKRNGLSKTPFWTTVSLHNPFAAPLARPDLLNVEVFSVEILQKEGKV